MTTPKTLVVASGVLLRAEPASERSTLLVEVRPGKKPETWRAVPNEDVEKHAQRWATAQGVEYTEVASARGSCPNTSAVNPDATQPVRLPSGHSTVGQPGETGVQPLVERLKRGPVTFTMDLDRAAAVGVIAESLRGHVK